MSTIAFFFQRGASFLLLEVFFAIFERHVVYCIIQAIALYYNYLMHVLLV